MEYYSAIKKKYWHFSTTWMDLDGIMLSEISQTEKDKYSMFYLYVESTKNDTNELIYRTETDSQT